MGGGDKPEKERRKSRGRGKRKEPVVPATGFSDGQTTVLPVPSVGKQQSFMAACPSCNAEKEYCMIFMSRTVQCDHCYQLHRATERNPLPRHPSTISSNVVNVPDSHRNQYEHALRNPHRFYSLVRSLSIAKNKPCRVPMFRGKELNLQRIFTEVTSRSGIFVVAGEGRLSEVSATIDKDLADSDLYEIYMQASVPYASSAPVNNNQQLTRQPIQASAPVNNDPQMTRQPIQASAPVNNNQQLTKPIQASAPVNNNPELARQLIQASAPVNNNQQLTRQPPIQALAPYTNSAPVNNNQQLTRQPIQTSAPVNNNQQLTRYLTDDPQDFHSDDEWELLRQMLEDPEVGSTSTHGMSTPCSDDMLDRNLWEHPGEAEHGNSETGSSLPSPSKKQS